MEFVLSRNRRDDIMKAVKAIEREMKEMTGKPDWQVGPAEVEAGQT